jgi:hypothetical protein
MVVAVVVIERLTGFNLFTLSVWVVVPAGALITGAAAASGYYFGSLFFHTKPVWFLLVQMVIVAAVAQFAIYYAEYATMVLDDGDSFLCPRPGPLTFALSIAFESSPNFRSDRTRTSRARNSACLFLATFAAADIRRVSPTTVHMQR